MLLNSHNYNFSFIIQKNIQSSEIQKQAFIGTLFLSNMNPHDHMEGGDESAFNRSDYQSLGNSRYAADSDQQDDQQMKQYHQMLKENLSQEGKSQNLSPYEQINHDFEDDETEKQSVKSLKSQYSSQSLKSLNSQNSLKSLQTLRTNQSGVTVNGASREYSKQKRKYMKQEARRIKQQLKQEQMRLKNDIKELDFDFDGKRRNSKAFGRQKRRRLTKKTLELLSKKFDQYYACENNYDYKGPKMSIREIGHLFDMGNSTIHKLYTEWMEDPSFYERINRQNLKKKTPQRKVTLERLEHVARLIKENPFLTQNELTVELNKIEDLKYLKNGKRIDITRTTVARLLKVGKFKKKRVKCVPKERNTTKSLQKRFDYCSKYKQIYLKNSKIYFLDESGFNLYMTRDKAWARPNEQITVNCPISKGKRFSLIAIIGDDGLVHWRIIEGTYRKYEYLDFIKSLFTRLREQMDPTEQNQPEKWLILDNCAIHDKEQTVNLGKECDMQILYLPPYSPQLNPIQNWFHEVKAIIRKINYTGEKQLLQIMHRTLKGYQQHDFSGYYSSILKHVEKGINKQRF